MSGTFVYARQMWALKQRVNQHERSIRERLAPASHGGDLWQFIKEAHAVAPKFFCKGNLWNKFLDLILEDDEQLRILGLSAAAVELTRYGRSPPPAATSDLQSSRQDANFRNELVFAEVVAGQSDELRPLYAELYEFFYKVPPETMYIKVRFSNACRAWDSHLDFGYSHMQVGLPNFLHSQLSCRIYWHPFLRL